MPEPDFHLEIVILLADEKKAIPLDNAQILMDVFRDHHLLHQSDPMLSSLLSWALESEGWCYGALRWAVEDAYRHLVLSPQSQSVLQTFRQTVICLPYEAKVACRHFA